MIQREQINKKIVHLQVLEANMKILDERFKIITERVEELQKTRNAVEELKTTKPSKAMIPLGSGNFVFGSIDHTEDIVVGIGAGVAIKKKREQSIEILDDRLKELESILNEISGQMQIITEQSENIQSDIEKLQK